MDADSDFGSHTSEASPNLGLQADNKEAVAEARLRLLAGLKRYFHSKAAEGLLSGTVRARLACHPKRCCGVDVHNRSQDTITPLPCASCSNPAYSTTGTHT